MTLPFDPYTGYPSANVGDSKSFYSAYMQSAGANSSSALLDISSIKLPGNTIRKLYPLLEYYATMDCSIAPAIQKMSLYPIMPLDFSHFKEEALRKNAEDFFNNILNIHNTMSVMSLNWNVYGFAAVSLFFPFRRVFTCQKCQRNIYSDFVKDFQFKRFSFYFKCPHCGDSHKEKEFSDSYYDDKTKVRFITWRPHDIEFIYSQFSGEYQFFYKMPPDQVKLLQTGNKFLLDRTPKFIIQALKDNNRIAFRDGEIFTMFRPDFSREGSVTPEGLPLILNVLTSAYLKKVFSKASEVSGVLRASPASVIYPETNPGAGQYGNPLMSVPIESFSEYFRTEIAQHRRDPGHVLISPTPIGQQNLFGEAKQYHYFQEMKFQEQDILQGMGIPREFVEGGLSFGLASVPARILESQLKKQINELNRFLSWAKDKLSTRFPLGEYSLEMKPFRMADDLQLVQMQLQAAAQGDLSKKRIWESLLDINYEEELERVRAEDKAKYPSHVERSIADTTAQLKAVQLQRNFEAQQQVEDQRVQAAYMANSPGELQLQQLSQQAQIAAQQATQTKAVMEQLQMANKDLERKFFQQQRLYDKEKLEREKLQQQQNELSNGASSADGHQSGASAGSAVSPRVVNTLFPIYKPGDPMSEKSNAIASTILNPNLTPEFVLNLLNHLLTGSDEIYYNVVHAIINNQNTPHDRFNLVMTHFNNSFSKIKNTAEQEKKTTPASSKPQSSSGTKTENKSEKKTETKKEGK